MNAKVFITPSTILLWGYTFNVMRSENPSLFENIIFCFADLSAMERSQHSLSFRVNPPFSNQFPTRKTPFSATTLDAASSLTNPFIFIRNDNKHSPVEISKACPSLILYADVHLLMDRF
ncbi:hypothetical protein KP509_10G001300 [Ceratopteris richardii]|uniref:Uncharacterized protein n=1 Tax=Ceratopteris richardii TaxID=49495 RepID=A0A8T2TVH5_CERRI|nr:hypothetical protein KP509_10G001300 [Ceratopteris richardii]